MDRGGHHFEKIEKSSYLGRKFQRFQRNLAGWRSLTLVTVWSVTNLKFKEIQDGGGRHPKKWKITTSRQLFDRSAKHLAWWRIVALQTRPQLKFRTFNKSPRKIEKCSINGHY